MSDAAVMPPIAPARGSLVGRLLTGFVPYAGVAGTAGAIIGSLAGPVGAGIGMTVGVVGAMAFTGAKFGKRDTAKWREYEGERQQYMADTGEWWPNARKSWGRKAKMLGGTGVAVGAMALLGVGIPAVTAVPALVFYGSMMAGAYLLARLAMYRRGRRGGGSDDVDFAPDHDPAPGRRSNAPLDATLRAEPRPLPGSVGGHGHGHGHGH